MTTHVILSERPHMSSSASGSEPKDLDKDPSTSLGMTTHVILSERPHMSS